MLASARLGVKEDTLGKTPATTLGNLRGVFLRAAFALLAMAVCLFSPADVRDAHAASLELDVVIVPSGGSIQFSMFTDIGDWPNSPTGSERPDRLYFNGPCTNEIRFSTDSGAIGRDLVVQFPGPGWTDPFVNCHDLGRPGTYTATFQYTSAAAGGSVLINQDFVVKPINLSVSPAEIEAGDGVSISISDVITQGQFGEKVIDIEVRCPGGATSTAVSLSLQSLNDGNLAALSFPGASFTNACQGIEVGTYLVRLRSLHQQVTATFVVVGDRDNDGINDPDDNCPDDANPGQEDEDHDGDGDACDPDADRDQDRVANDDDNCPDDANTGQEDTDGDGLGDECDPNPNDRDNDDVDDFFDNCPTVFNPGQEDDNDNDIGNACETDTDGDGVPNFQNGFPFDNCPLIPNPDQLDSDFVPDGFGDACDIPDSDGDGVSDETDNCDQVINAEQTDTNGDGQGDACDTDDDSDGDSVPDASDNCPNQANPGQADSDNDNVGDVCETEDTDGDGHANFEDNCPFDFNPGQFDEDNDGTGDLCDFDADTDSDGVPDALDNCKFAQNADQADTDNDGAGDACDPIFVDSDGDGLSDEEEEELGTDPNSPTSFFPGINPYTDGQPTGTSNPATAGDPVGVAIDAPDNVTSVGVEVTDPDGDTKFQDTLIPHSPVVFSFTPDSAGDWIITADLFAGEELTDTLTLTLPVVALSSGGSSGDSGDHASRGSTCCTYVAPPPDVVLTFCVGTQLHTSTNGMLTDVQVNAPQCAPPAVQQPAVQQVEGARSILPPSTGDAGLASRDDGHVPLLILLTVLTLAPAILAQARSAR